MTSAYERLGISGTAKVEFRVRDGAVVEVNPVAGPNEYYCRALGYAPLLFLG